MGRTQFSLLGPLLVRRAGVVIPVTAGKQRALLAALLLQAGRPVGADELAEVVWESKAPQSARATLQTYVGRLRTLLEHDGDPVIVTEAAGYRIDAGPDELDVAGFESALAAGRAAIRVESWAKAAEVLAEGLMLWRGQPLAGVPSDVLAAREVPRLAELRTQALEARIEADLRLGRHAEVILELRQLVAAEPLRERLHALLMTALYRDGQQSGALEAYQAARATLVGELGVEPGPELRRLQERILTADPALLTGAAQLPAAELLARPGAAGTSPEQDAEAGRPSRAPAETRYSLPPDPAAFTGRDSELDSIVSAASRAAASGEAVTIRAIGGMPGIGKTTLAVHAAHLLRDRFPDRQLFIDLHGHTPGQEPLTPEAALASLLADTGADARSLPEGLTARTSLWRDRMAGQRALLVLDNAASSAQVAPLLPGGSQCLALITSRRHLADLPGAITPLHLQTLAPDEACLMFVRLAPRAADEAAAAVTELVELAGWLPLAISLLARMHNRHPSWSLADLTAETRAGLLTLTAERDNVAAVFEISCQDLDPGVRQFFWRLGLHPGVTVDCFAAAALGGVPVAEATGMLDLLQGEGLLAETRFRRYGMHDLIRRYTRDRAAAELSATAAEQAVSRLLDYYQHTAARADTLLARQIRTIPESAVAVPAAAPVLASSGQARAWARAERANLLACIDYAAARQQDARVVALTAGSAALFYHDGPWTEAQVRHAAAAEAARRIDDRRGRADALSSLGTIRRMTSDVSGASLALTEALGLFQELADERGQADALTDLGEARYGISDYAGAARFYTEALSLSRHLGERLGQARVLCRLGTMRWRTRDYERASRDLTQAGLIYRDLDDRLGQAAALSALGLVRRDTGDLAGAIGDLEEGLAVYRDLGSRLGQAFALYGLGIARRKAGDYPGASRDLEEAVAAYRETGDRGGHAEVLNELGTLHRARGDAIQARESHRLALSLAREIASPHDEACALAGLARCALDAGDVSDAVADLCRAHKLFEQAGAAEAAGIAAELAALPAAAHSPR